MIDKDLLKATIDHALEGTDLFLVDLKVSHSNDISVEIDSDSHVDIEQCVALTRAIESVFNRNDEDYELEVGSVGLTSPLKLYRQFARNIGNEMVVLTKDSRKLHGVLSEARQLDPANPENVEFVLRVKKKVKEEGAKRPKTIDEDIVLTTADCSSVVYDLKF